MPSKKKEPQEGVIEQEQATKKAADEAVAAIENNEMLMYKGRALVRQGDIVIYGNPEDAYLVSFTIRDKKMVGDLPVATNVVVQLMVNGNNEDVTKNRPVKRAERDGLYDALDIGVYWLQDILKQIQK